MTRRTEGNPEPAPAADTTVSTTFTVHREPPLAFTSTRRQTPRRESSSRRRRESRRPKRLIPMWWLVFAAPALALGALVSLWWAGAAGVTRFVTPNRAQLIERAICYSPDSTEYNRCIVSRDNARLRGAELLKPSMLTPFRVSLCARLQVQFSVGDFWDCVKALRDPRR